MFSYHSTGTSVRLKTQLVGLGGRGGGKKGETCRVGLRTPFAGSGAGGGGWGGGVMPRPPRYAGAFGPSLTPTLPPTPPTVYFLPTPLS